ncbi:MAG: sulfotransferase [Porticoccus sp.]
MPAKYVKPSRVKRYIQRYRRNAPSIVVDTVDFLSRFPPNFRLKYPYSNGLGYQPFFIMGCGRSGNTLLRKLLMERAHVAIPPEFPGLGSTIRRFSQEGGRGWPEIVESVLSIFHRLADIDVETVDASNNTLIYNLANEIGLSFESLSHELNTCGENDRSLARIISSIYEAYSIKVFGGVRPWGDKTPWNVFHYQRIRKVFPEARYVHMLRDGRDCVSSYVDSLRGLMNIDCVDAAYRWRDSVRRMNTVKRENPSRFLEVRYEDLVSNPDKIVFGVIKFLGLDAIKHSDVHTDMLGDGAAVHHKNLSRPVSNKSVGRWRKDLTEVDKITVLKLISNDLERFGYPVC